MPQNWFRAGSSTWRTGLGAPAAVVVLVGSVLITPTTGAGFAAQTGTGASWASGFFGHSLWGWGVNTAYQLGVGDLVDRLNPVQVSSNNWDSVAAGKTASCGIRYGGELWCMGAGFLTVPTRVGTFDDWLAVDGGEQHFCTLRDPGTLWCWGQNAEGRTGLGVTAGNTADPTQVGSFTDWTSVSVGKKHSCAVRSNGTLWCWGANNKGQVGNGTVGEGPGAGVSSPTQVAPGWGGVWAAVAAGGEHTCAVRTNATLWCWGKGNEGQLGNGTSGMEILSTTPVQAAAGASGVWAPSLGLGENHACALRTDQSLWCWGANNEGQLGTGGTGPGSNQSSPAKIGSASWSSIAVGGKFTCGVQVGKSLWCWGSKGGGPEGTVGALGQGAVAAHVTTPGRVITAGGAPMSAHRVHAGATASTAFGLGLTT